ncbi:GLPGLI family protein [Mucilaginibacter sp.]|uniref:GLPGLI family protein n=1 Tax=Mucilaginibacter sp. TaxID=1882438 RepID=UPI00260A5990|nr:GLPGLI family protein [Mucilaginibacter sp.]MDB4926257.1 hypothetical protein [Mucilaginibacter sp.]
MKAIIIFFIGLLTGSTVVAQHAKFITTGTIEYDKTINMFAIARGLLNKNDVFSNQAFEQYQKNQPQFVKFKGKLIFNKDKTLFTTERPIENVVIFQANPLANQYNTTYVDFSSGISTILRSIQGQDFLVKDSIRKIKWRIMGDTREIAGYTCREAHGVVQDSIYVVAFYTDKIWVSGGPESFSGLPGMILQVTLPREHVTWAATKVTIEPVPDAALTPPQKGKPISNKQLVETLRAAFSARGSTGKYQLKIFTL